MNPVKLTPAVLEIDCVKEIERITAWMIDTVGKVLHRRGVIIALSGGVDSSVCGALAVQAFGPSKIYGLLLPEHDSNSNSVVLGRKVAEQLGITCELLHIGPTLEALGCYRLRDEAMRTVFPDYGPTWKSKLAIAGGLKGRINYFKLVVETPQGEIREARLPIREYLQIVAATNYKQRIRKTVEYFHADRLNYAVIGTPNRLEYDQGFFVKNGDGSADLKPIAHLYKTQVYSLARHLGLPEEVCNAAPTTDTYSLRQGQDEFYFALPYQQMDLALWAFNHDRPSSELAEALGLSEGEASLVYADIQAKRRTTYYLHARPMMVEPVLQIAG
jgi:NAD+ synthase